MRDGTRWVTSPPLHGDAATASDARRARLALWLVAGGVILAVLSVVLVRVVIVRLASPEPVAFPVPSGPYTFTIQGYEVHTSYGRNKLVFRVARPTGVSAVYQRGPVFKDGQREMAAELAVYRPGAFDPEEAAAARLVRPKDVEEVDVAGRSGIVLKVPGRTTLAWEYTTGAWATLDAVRVPPESLVAIAAGLRPGSQVPARLPFRLDYVPDGYAPIEVTDGASPGDHVELSDLDEDEGYGGVLFVKPSPPTKGMSGVWNEKQLIGSLSISVERGDGDTQAPARNGPYCEYAGRCIRWSPDRRLKIVALADNSVPVNEVMQVLRGVQLVAVDQPETWPLATDVLQR